MTARATALFMLLILLIAVLASGCTPIATDPWAKGSLWGLGGAFAALVLVCFMFGDWRLAIVFVVTSAALFLAGCAALPMPLQPANQQYNSNMAEGGFIVLAAIDTAQSMHIRKGTSCDHEADPIAATLYGSKYPKPGRVLLTNLALITVHTMVTSWLDDKVAEHDALHDGSVGPWYIGRVVWHGASLLAEGSAVINNKARGCVL